MTLPKQFYYHAWIMRDNRKIMRQGSVVAAWPLDGLDAVCTMAEEEWQVPLISVDLYDLTAKNPDGTMVKVGTTTMMSRMSNDKQVIVHTLGEQLDTPPPTPVKPTWTGSQVGTVWSRPTFNTLKLGEQL